MSATLWTPTVERIERSGLYQYLKWLNQKYNENFATYEECHRWSIENPGDFWRSLISYFNIKHEGSTKPAYKDLSFLHYPWFPNVRLNFAENLLSSHKSNNIALVECFENTTRRETSYAQLYKRTLKLQSYIKKFIKKGDVVAAYMPNISETVVSMLATTSLGGVFTSTSSDFGVKGVIDRFGQSRPKVLIAAVGYEYNGKYIDLKERLAQIEKELPFLEKIILVDFLSKSIPADFLDKGIMWNDLPENFDQDQLQFEACQFSDPLYIMYSSGTTGKPKCIVHSVGGTLLQHVKEIGLHSNHNQEKTIFYFTTCGWMMWNWLVSSLFFGGKTVLYEGSPGYPSLADFFNIINREQINIFGTSPKFLKALETSGQSWDEDFPSLETILSTGAPLLPEQFDFVYQQIKSNVQLASIAGGTDIIGCFMLGNPLLPVVRGEIQAAGLGMDVACFDYEGKPLIGKEGELVCRRPFVSQPIGFLNDENDQRFRDAYFNRFNGVWHHGDFIQIEKNGGIIVYGRSDATLNPGGVRIGTAEIYRQTEQLSYLKDSICVGKQVDGDVEVWLFVQMSEGQELTSDKVNEIKNLIKQNTTPRHVPRYVYTTGEIPYTRSGKKMELAVTRLINKKELTNIEAVANPGCLEEYKKFAD